METTIEVKGPNLSDANANAKLRRAVEERLVSCCKGEPNDAVERCVRHETTAERTLQEALAAVRDRHTKYGPPSEHFARTASLVNAAFGTSFTAADWALVMVLDKVARLRGPTPTSDGGIDIAGYGGCYEECRRG